ncbi:MAG: TonB-dependent receptor [Chitinophagaceae bacterium]|nr:TonB-dependent receptor [Chitinophagaceae bacterium]
MRKFVMLITCLFLGMSQLMAQTKEVTGKVTDSKDGSALAGVTINAAGKSVGTSNADGSFKVTVPQTVKSLTFTFVGYKQVTASIGAGSLNIQLETNESSLGEVVVTGYQTLQKRQVTGAIATVKAETIKNIPIGSFDQILQGQAAGTLIQANSGQPGAAANVTIRGVGSVNGTTQPLYILDGIQISAQNFSSLNPNDFETVTVLKDASTTAQYGSRGANGVIVITTKRGKSGKTRFEYNGIYGQSRFPKNKLEIMETAEKLDYEIARGNPYGWNTAKLDSLKNINTNWQDELTQTGITNSHQLSASGGSDKTVFFISGGIFKQTGTVKRTGLDRYSARVNIEHTATNNLKFGINSYGGWSNYLNTTEANTGIASPLNAIRWGNPYERPFNPNTGTYQQFTSGQPNPIQDINETTRGTKEFKFVGNAFLEAKLPFITKGLSFRTNWGLDYENWDQTLLFTRFSVVGQAANGNQGRFDKDARILTRYTGTTSLNYTKSIKDHNFSVGLYNEWVTRVLQTYGFSGFGLTGNFQNGAGVTNGSATFLPSVRENRTENAILSYYSLATYSFKNKYFLNGSFRRDGSSRFGVNNRIANFYSIGAGWVISDEQFFKPVRFVDNFKLSVSYGKVGNQEGIGDFASRELFTNRSYTGINGPGISQLPNPDLTWEERSKFNAGINAVAFKGRITLGVDFYSEVTNLLFLNNQLSRTTGFASLNTNIGKVRNRGWEFTLITENVKKRNFYWSTTINFTVNRNKLLALTPTAPPTGVVVGTTVQRIGYPLNSNYVVKYEGVNPNNGNAIYRRPNGVLTELYDDVNDRQIFGTRDAPYFGGFTNKFTVKGVDFSVFFTYLFGNIVYNNDRTNVEDPSYFFDNMSRAVSREWRKPGDITDIPRATLAMRRVTTRFLEDGSFLRLRNVQLGYSLPESAIKKIKLTNVRFYLMGENLWTGFKFLGFDPELSSGVLTGAQYPALRTLTAGLTIGF